VSDSIAAAADRLVAAFGEGRVEDYFACFAPDATFVFHTTPERLGSRADYRRLWHEWETGDGFRIVSCTSSNAEITPLGADVGVFVHDVDTRVATRAGEESLRERETIVFARRNGRWLGVHEHLSVDPGA
jgi:ketosteroid isomerase-like protein